MSRIKGVVLAMAVAGLAACNTVSGAGQDISVGGKAISNSAEKVQSKISN
jgi:predicted small secreted protein